jgi:hypothetical protein
MTLSSGPLLHLTLGVAPRRSGDARCLWSTRAAPMGQTPQAPTVCTDSDRLQQRLGSACLAGMEAIVPRHQAATMTAAMHLALALYLRQQGRPGAADSVEQAWRQQRHTSRP